MALKGARVSDYNGKSLNAGEEHCQMFIDPEHKKTQALKRWYRETAGSKKNFNSVTF